MIIALEYSLKTGIMILPASLIFPKIVLAIQGPYKSKNYKF